MSVPSKKPSFGLSAAAAALIALGLASACTMDVGKPNPGPQITEKSTQAVQSLPPIWGEPLTPEERRTLEAKQKEAAAAALPYSCEAPKGWLKNTASEKGMQYTEYIAPADLKARITVYPFAGSGQKEPEIVISDLCAALFQNIPQLITADIVGEKMLNTDGAQIFSRRFNAVLELEPAEWIAVLSCARLKDKTAYAIVLSAPQNQSEKALAAYDGFLNSIKAAEGK